MDSIVLQKFLFELVGTMIMILMGVWGTERSV